VGLPLWHLFLALFRLKRIHKAATSFFSNQSGVFMAQDDSSSSATGGLLVVLGIIIALVVAYVLYQQGYMGNNSGPTVIVETPAP